MKNIWMKKNVVLCGFMGCGKTTLGSMLAKKLFCEFVDVDEYIENEQKMKISEIFEKHGEQYFRDIEHTAILKLSRRTGCIIATGGGAAMFSRNTDPLKASGIIVLIDATFDVCYERIASTNRPIVISASKSELETLYNERIVRYREICDYNVFNHSTPEDAVKVLILTLKSNNTLFPSVQTDK